jgi:mRNA-degrading endonuclease toxin of MazEF toxin-antitoxin module
MGAGGGTVSGSFSASARLALAISRSTWDALARVVVRVRAGLADQTLARLHVPVPSQNGMLLIEPLALAKLVEYLGFQLLFEGCHQERELLERPATAVL